MKIQLPKITEKSTSKNKIEETLLALKAQIEDTYNGKILMLIFTSTTYNNNEENVLSYAVYLSFINRNKFSYRLFEINCLNADGGMPVELLAFTGPSESFGIAKTKLELEKGIEKIFKDKRTKNIILSNYNL